jgi:hypothetical protein
MTKNPPVRVKEKSRRAIRSDEARFEVGEKRKDGYDKGPKIRMTSHTHTDTFCLRSHEKKDTSAQSKNKQWGGGGCEKEREPSIGIGTKNNRCSPVLQRGQ